MKDKISNLVFSKYGLGTIYLGSFFIGLDLIYQGSMTFVGNVGELRGIISIEKNSFNNIFGYIILILSLGTVHLSFIVNSYLNLQFKKKLVLFLQILAIILILLAGLSYFLYIEDTINHLSTNTIAKNFHIAGSSLFGVFGFIGSLIILGTYKSMINTKKNVLTGK